MRLILAETKTESPTITSDMVIMQKEAKVFTLLNQRLLNPCLIRYLKLASRIFLTSVCSEYSFVENNRACVDIYYSSAVVLNKVVLVGDH